MLRKTLATIALVGLPLGTALADDWVREILSSGATTASTYLTSREDKLVKGAQEDAVSFVASDGAIRGPYLESALRTLRTERPDLAASDLELARAILAAE